MSEMQKVNFRVPADLERRFRKYADDHNMSLSTLFRLAIEDYLSKTQQWKPNPQWKSKETHNEHSAGNDET